MLQSFFSIYLIELLTPVRLTQLSFIVMYKGPHFDFQNFRFRSCQIVSLRNILGTISVESVAEIVDIVLTYNDAFQGHEIPKFQIKLLGSVDSRDNPGL